MSGHGNNWYKLYQTPFVTNPMDGLDPSSPVRAFYPQMNDSQKKVIDDRLAMFQAGVALLIFGFLMFCMSMYIVNKNGGLASNRFTKSKMCVGGAFWIMVIGAVLVGPVGSYYSDAPGDAVYQVLMGMVTPTPTMPPGAFRRRR